MLDLHLSFYFRVTFFLPEGRINPNQVDTHFQSVSGLEMTMQTEVINEGGKSGYAYKVQVRTEFSNVTLKRGFFADSSLIKWCTKNFKQEKGRVYPAKIRIELLQNNDQNASPTTGISWEINQAFPVKWSFSDLNAEENGLLIESLELTFDYYTLKS